MPNTTIVAIRARTRSTRLYAKCLQPLAGKPAIVHVGERAGTLRDVVGKAVFCIPEGRADDELVDVLQAYFSPDPFYAIHRGPEKDPVARTMQAVERFGADIIIEGIHGDAPLSYMGFVRPALQMLEQNPELDCVRHWNPECEFTIEHFAGYAWPTRLSWWEKTARLRDSTQKCYREHPTLFFQWNPEHFDVGFIEWDKFHRLCKDFNGRKWGTRYDLDYPEDLVFLSAIFDALHDGDPILLEDAVNYVNSNSYLRSLNASRAESPGTYPTPWQRMKWARTHGEWVTPEGYNPIYCVSGSCYLGYNPPGTENLVTLDGHVIREGTVSCICGEGRMWRRTRKTFDKNLPE